MKVLLMLSAVLAVAMTAPEAPAPPPGWRPSGRLLFVPARQVAYPPPAEATPLPETNSTETSKDASDDSKAERILDAGEYYVLLEDGRLQMVKYKTSALKEESKKEVASQNNFQQQQNFQQQKEAQNAKYQQQKEAQYYNFEQVQQEKAFQQNSQYRNPFPEGSSNFQQKEKYVQFQQVKQAEPFAQFQIEYVQFPQYTQPEAKPQEGETAQVKAEEKEAEEESGFQANVQYRDVKPISAPIYAYNPTPLVRILKK